MKYNLKKLDYKKQIDLLELACDCSEHADALYTLREWFEGFEKELRKLIKHWEGLIQPDDCYHKMYTVNFAKEILGENSS